MGGRKPFTGLEGISADGLTPSSPLTPSPAERGVGVSCTLALEVTKDIIAEDGRYARTFQCISRERLFLGVRDKRRGPGSRPGREREPGAEQHQNRQAYAKRQPQDSRELHGLTCGQACRHLTESVVDVYGCGGRCGRACGMRSHGFLLCYTRFPQAGTWGRMISVGPHVRCPGVHRSGQATPGSLHSGHQAIASPAHIACHEHGKRGHRLRQHTTSRPGFAMPLDGIVRGPLGLCHG